MTDFLRLPSEETAKYLLGLYDTIAWQNKFIETHLLGNIPKLGCICLAGFGSCCVFMQKHEQYSLTESNEGVIVRVYMYMYLVMSLQYVRDSETEINTSITNYIEKAVNLLF